MCTSISASVTSPTVGDMAKHIRLWRSATSRLVEIWFILNLRTDSRGRLSLQNNR